MARHCSARRLAGVLLLALLLAAAVLPAAQAQSSNSNARNIAKPNTRTSQNIGGVARGAPRNAAKATKRPSAKAKYAPAPGKKVAG